ncbi:MAG: potassium channel family protein [Gammaproteobacteria bacterium]|nr:potassium channel family protein [Gammaproteobacteria bacterium]
MLIVQFALGCLLIGLTVIVHGLILDRFILAMNRNKQRLIPNIERISTKSFLMVATVLVVFLSHIIQIWIWAGFYLAFDILPDLESALYFSTSAFTTVGFGDVYLDQDWRLISSFEAANGFILFGWSTAFIFEVMNRAYK